jgi:hypothetical protein
MRPFGRRLIATMEDVKPVNGPRKLINRQRPTRILGPPTAPMNIPKHQNTINANGPIQVNKNRNASTVEFWGATALL